MATQRKQRKAEREFRPDPLKPMNAAQAHMINAMQTSSSVIAVGPAGTGKTYIAAAWAAEQLFNIKTSRIVLCRPTVGVGRSLGFLPGRLGQKLDPWARPLVDVFKQTLSAKRYEQALREERIEVGSIEHVRGLTFEDSIVIIDEAQNTTPGELKALTTRIGEDSTIIVCGDTSQTDLPGESGLAWLLRAHSRGWLPSSFLCKFAMADIVRSGLCREFAEAFEQLEDEQKSTRSAIDC